MIIFFNIEQFPDALDMCHVNDIDFTLVRDILFVPTTYNQILIIDELDLLDLYTFFSHAELFVNPFISAIINNFSESQLEKSKSFTCAGYFLDGVFPVIKVYEVVK